jgi:hypothetical protein
MRLTPATLPACQVYYIYRRPFYCQSTFPTIFGSFPIIRVIMLREGITMLHAHQAFSTLGLEALLHARTMGYKVRAPDTTCPAVHDQPRHMC